MNLSLPPGEGKETVEGGLELPDWLPGNLRGERAYRHVPVL